MLHWSELIRHFYRPAVHKRDYISVSKIDHHSNKTVTKTTDPATLFADSGACMLMVSTQSFDSNASNVEDTYG